MSALPRARADLQGFAPYRTQQMQADVRLQANEWPEPVAAGRYLTAEQLDDVLLNRYPAAPTELRATLAAQWGVAPERLILGNGSNEVLLNTFLVFGGHDRVTLLFQPTYSMHGRLTTIAGGTVAEELVGLPYAVDRGRALAAAERARPDIVVFCTPNNPTGTVIPNDVIVAVAERHPETLVLVDEAYAEFAGTTIVPEIAAHPNIVVSKTFSKVRAAAGLRLGVLIADERVVEMFRAVQLPYNVSALTHAVAAQIARDDGELERRVALITRERERLFAALSAVDAVEPFPSQTNFILFRVRAGDTAAAHGRILESGVLVRDISSWPACDGCLRVTVGTPAENDRFIAALDHAFAATAPA